MRNIHVGWLGRRAGTRVASQPQLAGGHWIVVARVHDLLADDGREPLVFSDGRLGSFVELETQGP